MFFHHRDLDSTVNVLDQWDFHGSLYFLSHRHLSLHLHKDARNLRSKVVLVKRELCVAVL